MAIDWVTIAATFGAAIAGSWFGATATNRQTKSNIQMEENRWLRERCFEFIEASDDFLNISFRKEVVPLPERDRLTKRLVNLASFVAPESRGELVDKVYEIRNIHINKSCSIKFHEFESYIESLQEKVREKLNNLRIQNV